MGRKPKFEADIKLEIVEDILDNKYSIGYAARLINLNYSSSIKCSHKSQFKDVLL